MEKTLLENLITTLVRYRAQYAKAFGMLFLANLLLVINPIVFRQALLALHPNGVEKPSFLASFIGPSLWTWVFLLCSFAMVAAYYRYWMRLGFMAVSRDVEKEVREKLFTCIQSQSRAFFDRHGIGELLSRLTNDIALYRDLLGPGIMFPLFCLTLVGPGMIALFFISTPLALLAMVPLILIPIIHALIRKHSYRLSHEVQKQLGEMSNEVQEHYTGIRIVKSYVIETASLQRFARLCRSFATLNFKMSSLQGLLFPLFMMISRMTTVLLVLLTGYISLQAWQNLSGADFVSFMWVQGYVLLPIFMLGWMLPIYDRGSAAYARLVEIYQEPVEVTDNVASPLRIPPKADIHFKNLSFTYPDAAVPALSHFNLHIKGGTFVGITGPIGAGKSTLFYLLNREYEIPYGMLYIGGHEIHDYSLSAFRTEMVTVEQVSFLFSRSVADNVRFGRVEATQEELTQVAQYAALHDAVMEFPEQYDTLVGERGVTLSGGQKQRVAIARAFLVNRSILLLDDIFSAVDTKTEKQIFDSIRHHFSDRTILLVTHRVSILEKLDRVIYMMNGKVEEDGSPQELLQKRGHFAALAELQHLSKGAS